jgi:hypothetical protein
VVITTPTSLVNSAGDKQAVCYKCDVEGHNSKEYLMKIKCLIYEKDSHITRRCVHPNQPKIVMSVVGPVDLALGFFVAQQVKFVANQLKNLCLV